MDKSTQLDDIITRLKTSKNPQDTKQIYHDWAATYNQDLDYFGYMAPQIGVSLFDDVFDNRAGLIFDAGCGTGLCGQALTERGYQRLHGGDFSSTMMAQAEKTGCYEKLIEIDLSQTLPLNNATYDGVICMGVYNPRLDQTFLPELLRILKPNGILAISCRPDYFDSNLHPQLNAYAKANRLIIEKISQQAYMVGQQVDASYVVLRKR